MPKRKTGIVFIILGAVLILSALLLFFHNENEDRNAGEDADIALQAVQVAISKRIETAPTETPGDDLEPEEPKQLPVVEIDGYGYIGYLSVPSLDLYLPVMSDWDYERLNIAPCRQFGSSLTDDLVVAGHNFKRHFGPLISLKGEETVTFTDMDGNINQYVVRQVETIEPNAVDYVQNSQWDLVLYTCTYGGRNRVMVCCDRV